MTAKGSSMASEPEISTGTNDRYEWHFFRNGDIGHAVQSWQSERPSALGSREALFFCGLSGPSYDPQFWRRDSRPLRRCKRCERRIEVSS